MPRSDLLSDLSSRSPSMVETVQQLAMHALEPTPLILVGVSGAGKTLWARMVHQWSGRRGAFVVMSAAELRSSHADRELCGDIRGAGLFAAAREGTILLNGFQNLKLSCQKALLDVIEARMYRPVGSGQSVALDCRVVIGMDEDPDLLVMAGRLHPHLRYRCGLAVVRVPAVEERCGERPAMGMGYDSFSSY